MSRSVNSIAWCTGGAQGFIDEAISLKSDVYLSGEVSERTPAVAKENDMILITRDTESGQACEENNLPCILLDNEAIFKIVTEKLENF